jgi:hypothetical protein
VTIPGVDALFLTIPALPLYLVTSVVDSTATRGLLWDSAHSLPFLNGVGIGAVYVLPGVAAIALFAFSVGRTVPPGGE